MILHAFLWCGLHSFLDFLEVLWHRLITLVSGISMFFYGLQQWELKRLRDFRNDLWHWDVPSLFYDSCLRALLKYWLNHVRDFLAYLWALLSAHSGPTCHSARASMGCSACTPRFPG